MSAYLWPLSRTTVLDLNGDIVPGAWLNFWSAGTTTPLVTYQDSALTAPHPVVIAADAAGRWPAVYMPYTDYRQRVRTPGGTLLFDDDGIANPAPATDGGGGDVPEAQLIRTGFILPSFEAELAGYVRLNGRTIGNAGSGATERANADCEALFIFNWNKFSNTLCPVSGGRGGSGDADFAANKTLTLIDARGRDFAGIDTMGTNSADRLSGATFSAGGATVIGSSGGAATHTLTTGELAVHGHVIGLNVPFNDVYTLIQTTGVGVASGVTTVNSVITNTTTTTPSSLTVSGGTNNAGSGNAHNNMPPFFLGTWLQKL